MLNRRTLTKGIFGSVLALFGVSKATEAEEVYLGTWTEEEPVDDPFLIQENVREIIKEYFWKYTDERGTVFKLDELARTRDTRDFYLIAYPYIDRGNYSYAPIVSRITISPYEAAYIPDFDMKGHLNSRIIPFVNMVHALERDSQLLTDHEVKEGKTLPTRYSEDMLKSVGITARAILEFEVI